MSWTSRVFKFCLQDKAREQKYVLGTFPETCLEKILANEASYSKSRNNNTENPWNSKQMWDRPLIS